MGDEIYIRDFAPTDRQLRELGNCIDTSYGYSAENLATYFASEINCEISATANGWLIYSEAVRDEKLVQKFSELVNFCKYKNYLTVDKRTEFLAIFWSDHENYCIDVKRQCNPSKF